MFPEKEDRINKEKEEGTYKEKVGETGLLVFWHGDLSAILTSDLCLQKKKYKKREQIEASTVGEAIEKMLERKKISSKINYDVLKDLNGSTGGSSPLTPDLPSGTPTQKRLSRRRRKTSETKPDFSTSTIIMRKRFRCLISATPKKKALPQAEHATLPAAEAKEPEAELSPDAIPDLGSASTVAPPPIEEEEDEVEEECVSALQLVGDYGCEEEEVF
uniref:Brf1 TBP-binding domain-containing protein n=1 Tax=Nothobranchius furzeri TaxID=105023 RepID=A0A8C6KQ12_NOTFU